MDDKSSKSSDASVEFEIDEQAENLVGQVIDDRYEVSELIGAGAMGQVYRAEHKQIRRPVAIKVIFPALASVPEFARRFEREAIAIGRLDHPNCVAIWDTGRLESGALYLAMQYLPGPSLEDVLAQGPLPEGRALHIARHLLSGLAHAHSAGIVHRDIKPSNVIVVNHEGDPDFAEILDFGVAKLAHTLEDMEASKLTRMGERFGTPAYMSPEQAVGADVDPRSDVYSVAVILYEMLAGRRPFDSPDAIELLAQHATKAAPSLADAGSRTFPAELEELVARGLEKRAEDRYASAAEFISAIDDLRGWGARQPLPPAPTPWWRTIRVAILAAVVVAVAIAGIVVLVWPSSDPSDRARQLLREGKPEQALHYLEDRREDIADNGAAQLVLGHSYAATRNYAAAVGAYRRAIKVDDLARDDATMRSNLIIMIDDDDVDVAVGAGRLAIELKDEKARTRVVEHASVHSELARRNRMRDLSEELGLGDRLDRVSSFELDLVQARSCEDRRVAVGKLRALGDKRAAKALERARDRKGNTCLDKDAEDAIRYLDAQP